MYDPSKVPFYFTVIADMMTKKKKKKFRPKNIIKGHLSLPVFPTLTALRLRTGAGRANWRATERRYKMASTWEEFWSSLWIWFYHSSVRSQHCAVSCTGKTRTIKALNKVTIVIQYCNQSPNTLSYNHSISADFNSLLGLPVLFCSCLVPPGIRSFATEELILGIIEKIIWFGKWKEQV